MFTRLNNTQKDQDIYKVLVQTVENKLPTPDKPWNGVTFKKEAVEKAVSGLKGKMVYDNTLSDHARERGVFNNTIFGQVSDYELDEEGNAYAYIDVFNKEYVPLMDKLAENYNNNVRLDEGFSTELKFNKNGKVMNPDKSVDVIDYNYTGLSLVNEPRDFSGVTGKMVNSILPEDIDEINKIGGQEMAEVPQNVVPNSEYIALLNEKSDLVTKVAGLETEKTNHENKIEKLEKENKKYQEDINKLNNSLKDYKEADKLEKESLTNSILEKVPEESKESVKKELDDMDLKTIKLVNSMSPQPKKEENKTLNNGVGGIIAGALGGNFGSSGSKKPKVGSTDYEQAHGVDIVDMCAKMNENLAKGGK